MGEVNFGAETGTFSAVSKTEWSPCYSQASLCIPTYGRRSLVTNGGSIAVASPV